MGIWGDTELFLGIWGANAKVLLGSRGNYFQGSGEINALFQGSREHRPPGGLTNKPMFVKIKESIKVHNCIHHFLMLLAVMYERAKTYALINKVIHFLLVHVLETKMHSFLVTTLETRETTLIINRFSKINDRITLST